MVARLGLGRPAARPVIAALLAGAAVQAVYPLLTAVTGESAELRAGWPFLLVGLFAYHASPRSWRGARTRSVTCATAAPSSAPPCSRCP